MATDGAKLAPSSAPLVLYENTELITEQWLPILAQNGSFIFMCV